MFSQTPYLLCYIPAEGKTITLIYKNIISFFSLFFFIKNSWNSSVKRVTELWYREDSKHLIIFAFFSFFFYETGTGQLKHFLISASTFFSTMGPSQGSFFFSPGIIPAFDFSKCCTFQTLLYPSTLGYLVQGQHPEWGIMSSHSSAGSLLFFPPRLKIFSHYIIFWVLMHNVVTLPSSMAPTQFLWHFCYVLFTLTQMHILSSDTFTIFKTKKGLNSFCKVNFWFM